MSRPIDADALMRAMYHRAFETDGDTMWKSGCWVRYRAIEQTVKEQPTIEPKRKRGEWMNINESEKWECSECGRMMWFSPRLGVKPSNYKFCPNCGARMTEEDV